MHTLTVDAVVDEIVATLAQQRRLTCERDAGYIALARAILADEPYGQEDFESRAA